MRQVRAPIGAKSALTCWMECFNLDVILSVGYGISFTRYFYKPAPLRTLEEIQADLLALCRCALLCNDAALRRDQSGEWELVAMHPGYQSSQPKPVKLAGKSKKANLALVPAGTMSWGVEDFINLHHSAEYLSQEVKQKIGLLLAE